MARRTKGEQKAVLPEKTIKNNSGFVKISLDFLRPLLHNTKAVLKETAFEAWLSLVERCVRDAEVVGSNPVAST